MSAAGLFVLTLSTVCIGLTLRTYLGTPSKDALRCGWAAMAGFAGLAALCFWKVHELRSQPGMSDSVALGQKFMMGYLVGLMVAAAGVSLQRRKLRGMK